MTIADRFAAALGEVSDPAIAGPELLPVRLSRAAAAVLGVDAAGLGLASQLGHWLPLGAGGDDASTAERMQFTAGEGPCRTARANGQPVIADEQELGRRWPAFTELLRSRTPFRAVVALPLGPAPWGTGAMDLYLRRSDALAGLDVFAATAVGELVSAALSDATVWGAWPPEGGPAFLHGPATRDRSRVWEAMGRVSMDLDVPSEEALALLRADAAAAGRTVDDVAADLLTGRLGTADLRPAR
ncbi:GAF domain-containing protein [Blastococcus sp. TBT05-19]|uniref:GAF domain-containing protein n=1 Tax=Blastococcus sp. TBT05-19 TaxID=2250581 RepID=UPI000DFAA754|nr:GAF domain-containing protein [Blastococcus sp. TBT05-19]RBY94398.1 GAF domain-containing protein [Blastococcus sp. TBT05-19]